MSDGIIEITKVMANASGGITFQDTTSKSFLLGTELACLSVMHHVTRDGPSYYILSATKKSVQILSNKIEILSEANFTDSSDTVFCLCPLCSPLCSDTAIYFASSVCSVRFGINNHNFRIQIWKFFENKITHSRELKGHTDIVRCLQYLSDGRLISASDDKTIKVWNTRIGEYIDVCSCSKHVKCIAVSKVGVNSFVITSNSSEGSNGYGLLVTKIEPAKSLQVIEGIKTKPSAGGFSEFHKEPVQIICFDSDERRRVLSVSDDVALVSSYLVPEDDVFSLHFPLGESTTTNYVRVSAVAWLPDGSIVTGGKSNITNDAIIRKWRIDVDKQEMKEVYKFSAGFVTSVTCLCIVDKSILAIGVDSYDHDIKVATIGVDSDDHDIKVANEGIVDILHLKGHKAKTTCMCMLPPVGNRYRLASGSDRNICIWVWGTEERSGSNYRIQIVEDAALNNCYVNCLCSLPDGFVSGSGGDGGIFFGRDFNVKVWKIDEETNESQCKRVLSGKNGHKTSVCSLGHLDGKYIISGSIDGIVKIWGETDNNFSIDIVTVKKGAQKVSVMPISRRKQIVTANQSAIDVVQIVTANQSAIDVVDAKEAISSLEMAEVNAKTKTEEVVPDAMAKPEKAETGWGFGYFGLGLKNKESTGGAGPAVDSRIPVDTAGSNCSPVLDASAS